MRIYTKAGDDGKTALIGGQRLPKDHLRIEAYGTVDELNCVLGVCRVLDTQDSTPRFAELLATLQDDLFVVGSDLAAREQDDLNAERINYMRIGDDRIAWLEQQIDPLEDLVGPFKYFVLPGGTLLAAQLHVARTACRRAERLVVALQREEPVSEAVLIYLNRLSDLCFIMARAHNFWSGVADVPWKGKAG
ncbi:MAG: cob(I)yrinic acid a,c-diamide adenosyltransferase [bacterium]